jgi:hypothetical protein
MRLLQQMPRCQGNEKRRQRRQQQQQQQQPQQPQQLTDASAKREPVDQC